MINEQQLMLRIVGNPVIRILSYPLFIAQYSNSRKEYEKAGYGEKIKKLKGKYEGEKCFIVGNGPSLELKDLEAVYESHIYSFGMNQIYDLFEKTKWRPDFFFVFDRDSIRSKYDVYANLPLERIFIEYSRIPKHKRKIKPNLYYYFSDYVFSLVRGKGFTKYVCQELEKKASFVTNVPHLCIEFAIYMGFKEIYLIGIDHDYSFGYGKNHADGIREGEHNDRKRFVTSDMVSSTKKFMQYREYADRIGVKIYNATRGGKLDVFDRVDFDTLFVNN